MHIIDQIKETLKAIVPLDTQEMKHLQFASDWIDSGSGIFRLEKPAIPNPHLVAYFLLLDPLQKKVLLVDHKNAGLWLPAGGHVELNEHPKDTVKREVVEELSIEASFLLEEPFFLTVSETVGQGTKHTDVSLWYLLKGCANTQYAFDKNEFHQIAWVCPDDIPDRTYEPYMQRCFTKLKAMQLLSSD